MENNEKGYHSRLEQFYKGYHRGLEKKWFDIWACTRVAIPLRRALHGSRGVELKSGFNVPKRSDDLEIISPRHERPQASKAASNIGGYRKV